MKTHRIKILQGFADDIVSGDKTFEIRENDRGYQRGDNVVFEVIDKAGLNPMHELAKRRYRITYVLNGWGLKEGYVVFGIKEIPREEESWKQ